MATWGINTSKVPLFTKVLIGAGAAGLAAGVVGERVWSPEAIRKHDLGTSFKRDHDVFLRGRAVPEGTTLSVVTTPPWQASAIVGAASGATVIGGLSAALYAGRINNPVMRMVGFTAATLGAASLIGNVASYQLR